MRTPLTRLYLAIRRLRSALEAGASDEPNLVRRKIAVLAALQASVNAMADGFEGTSSTLSRLRARGVAIREREGWVRLTSLVDLEGNVATVDLRLRLLRKELRQADSVEVDQSDEPADGDVGTAVLDE